MTEKQYKLEQWTSSSLCYSFPNGILHNGIGEVIARVESDLNSLYNENEQLKQREEILDSMIAEDASFLCQFTGLGIVLVLEYLIHNHSIIK